jgi:hypothetical protein
MKRWWLLYRLCHLNRWSTLYLCQNLHVQAEEKETMMLLALHRVVTMSALHPMPPRALEAAVRHKLYTVLLLIKHQ